MYQRHYFELHMRMAIKKQNDVKCHVSFEKNPFLLTHGNGSKALRLHGLHFTAWWKLNTHRITKHRLSKTKTLHKKIVCVWGAFGTVSRQATKIDKLAERFCANKNAYFLGDIDHRKILIFEYKEVPYSAACKVKDAVALRWTLVLFKSKECSVHIRVHTSGKWKLPGLRVIQKSWSD